MPESVKVTIGGHPFACYRLSEAGFINIAAIYVILCVSQGGSWKVLDVGQSGELGERIDNHPRKDCWIENCLTKNVWVCVYAMPSNQYSKEDRLKLEATLRQQYNPPCGER